MTSKNKKTIFFVSGGLVLLLIAGAATRFIYKRPIPKTTSQIVSQMSPQQIIDSETKVEDLLKTDNTTEALTIAKQMVADSKSGSDKLTSYQTIGSVYTYQKDCTNAKSYFSKALELNNDLPEVYVFESTCDLYTKNFQLSLTDSQKALTIIDKLQSGLKDTPANKEQLTELNSYKGAAHFSEGAAYIGLGERDQALTEIQTAAKIDPTRTEYQTALQAFQIYPADNYAK